MTWKKIVVSAAALAASSATVRPADACGGCFAPPSSVESVVTGHRMAFSTNATRTVLWDQFEYTGNPEDFSWVLPVRPGSYLEASTDAWFESLELLTATRVTPPQLVCAGSAASSSAGCFGSSDDSASLSGGSGRGWPPPVEVVHRGTVGPYETVTLRSEDPEALRNWLREYDYIIPSEVEPIIDAYVAEGSDFVALRLAPGKGIQQMTPVRVVTPGGDPLLPLRMVAAGAAPSVDITLFVIAEGRYGMPDMEVAEVDFDALSWDWRTNTSNYAALREDALRQRLKNVTLTTFSYPRAFSRSFELPNGGIDFFQATDGTQHDSFAPLYFAQAGANDPEQGGCAATGRLDDTRLVVDCGSPGCSTGGDRVSSSQFSCNSFTDIEAAMIGMRPANVWLTRLEMNLPRDALTADCVLEPVANDVAPNRHRAVEHRNPPCSPSVFASSVPPIGAAVWVGALGGMLVRRRRRAA